MSTAKLEELQSHCDNLTFEQVLVCCKEVATSWPVHKFQTDTIERQQVALFYAEKLQNYGDAWLPEARAWLWRTATNYPELFSDKFHLEAKK